MKRKVQQTKAKSRSRQQRRSEQVELLRKLNQTEESICTSTLQGAPTSVPACDSPSPPPHQATDDRHLTVHTIPGTGISIPHTESLLKSLGYSIIYRWQTWCECLLHKDGERWLGIGPCEQQALADAVGKMFPSWAGLSLLEWYISGKQPDREQWNQIQAGHETRTGDRTGAGVEIAHGELSQREAGHHESATTPIQAPAEATGEAEAEATVEAEAASESAARQEESDSRDTLPFPIHSEQPLAFRTPAPQSTLVDGTSARPVESGGDVLQSDESPSALRQPDPIGHELALTLQQEAMERSWAEGKHADQSSSSSPRPHAPDKKPHLNLHDALDRLNMLADRIEAEQYELGLAAPDRIRLMLLSWISASRLVEESNDDDRVLERIKEIVHKLRLLSKMWWPGSIPALQYLRTPRDAMEDLGIKPGPDDPAPNWDTVLRAAAKQLEQLEQKGEQDGLDEYGWADADATSPPPSDPDHLLHQIATRLEKATGVPLNGSQPPTSTRFTNPTKDLLTLLDQTARQARWIRGSMVNFELWAKVMGRLRWAAAFIKFGNNSLDKLLHPEFRPTGKWAKILGVDTDKSATKRRKKELLQNPPRPRLSVPLKEALKGNENVNGMVAGTWNGNGEPVGDLEDCLDWIIAAFQCRLDVGKIALLLQPFSLSIIHTDPTTIQALGRNERKRFRQLQGLLLQDELSQVAKEAMESSGDGQKTKLDFIDMARSGKPATAHPSDNDSDSEDEEDSTQIAKKDHLAEIEKAVREYTEGQRAIFISNRTDPELEKSIKETFRFAELEWFENNPRKIDAAVAKIEQQKYSMVLSATGWHSHSADWSLSGACKKAKVHYVRVITGRRQTSLLAAARSFGIPVPGK